MLKQIIISTLLNIVVITGAYALACQSPATSAGNCSDCSSSEICCYDSDCPGSGSYCTSTGGKPLPCVKH